MLIINHFFAKTIIITAFSLLPSIVNAYEVEYKGINYEIENIPVGVPAGYRYNVSGYATLVSISDSILNSGRVNIPSIIFDSENRCYWVKKIGPKAFINCQDLYSIHIPSPAVTVGENEELPKFEICDSAFFNASNLVNFICSRKTPPTLGSDVYVGINPKLNVVVPTEAIATYKNTQGWKELNITDVEKVEIDSIRYIISDNVAIVDSIYSDATDVAIEDSITIFGNKYHVASIDNQAFAKCNNLKKVTFNNNDIVSAKYTRYSNIGEMLGDDVNDIVLGDKITTIGDYAFYKNSSNCYRTFKVSGNIRLIGIEAFYIRDAYKQRIITKSGTKSVISFWNRGITIYNENGAVISSPYFKVSSTQTTLSLMLYGYYPEYTYTLNGNPYDGSILHFTGLRPGQYIGTQNLVVSIDDVNYSRSDYYDFHTQSISLYVRKLAATASSLVMQGYYSKGDAKIVKQQMIINDIIQDNDTIYAKGLKPATTYVVKYNIGVQYGNTLQYYTEFSKTFNVETNALTLTTLQPKVASPGNVIVAAESNIDDEETNVGFEWRRTDWTDDFTSNSGGAYLFEGTMEGYIRNLNTEKLWKYRPYYESNSGNRYYGDWVGIDPTNTSYFEPTVHTYAAISVDGNKAMVKGYVMRGSDNVTAQGFKYWKATAATRSAMSSNATVPSTAMTITASGNIMEAELSDLDFEADYNYVTFVTTSEGETFYGEERTFTTGSDLTGIEGVTTSANETVEVARYDLRGRKLATPQPGLNIIRMSDGSTRKQMVK